MNTNSSALPRLRTAFIGCGASIYPLHEKAANPARFELVGMADIDAALGQERAARRGIPFFASYRELLAAVQPELAVIMTPHTSHPAAAIAALESGAHVLVEKPMAIEVSAADRMIEVAAAAGRLLAVNFQHRTRPEIRTAVALLRRGELGDVQHVSMVAIWPRSHKYFRMSPWRGTWNGEGGGVLLNQSPHNLDLLCHLMGLPVRLVAWARTTLHPIETEDTVQAMFEWRNGAIGSLHVSTAESGQPERLEILGTRGRLEIAPGVLRFDRFDQELTTYFAETEELFSGPGQHVVDVPLLEGAGSHDDIYANLHAAVTAGAPLVADGTSARMSLEVANAIILSSRRGNAVELPLARAEYAQLLGELQSRGRPVAIVL